jgi:pyrroloquinoline-quinone synthase
VARWTRAAVINAGDGKHEHPTQALLDLYRRIVGESPVAAGIASVYAYERQVPQVAQAKIDGLMAHYGISDARTLAFFETHAHLDVEHSEAERRMIRELADGSESEVLDATRATTDAWWRFLDGVMPRMPAAA